MVVWLDGYCVCLCTSSHQFLGTYHNACIYQLYYIMVYVSLLVFIEYCCVSIASVIIKSLYFKLKLMYYIIIIVFDSIYSSQNCYTLTNMMSHTHIQHTIYRTYNYNNKYCYKSTGLMRSGSDNLIML